MDLAQFQRFLNATGFPCGAANGQLGSKTRAAATHFQRAFAGGRHGQPLLAIDGAPGPKTYAAAAEGGQLSPNFHAREFACRHCGRAYIRRELIVALERYRSAAGGPVRVVSGYRCVPHNKAVGGASQSMHTYAGAESGCAADVSGQLGLAAVQRLGVFGGIGYRRRDNLVVHVDTRQLVGRARAAWQY